MKHTLNCIKRLPSWRVILACALLFCRAFGAYTSLAEHGRPSLQEMVLTVFNDVTTFLPFLILLLVIAELGFSKHSTGSAQPLTRAVFLSLFFTVAQVFFCVLVLLFTSGVFLSPSWSTAAADALRGIPPITALLAIIPLFFLRFAFLISLVSAVNRRCKKIAYGYAAGLAVCLLDAVAYFHFSLFEPVGIFPFEHTFIESALNLTGNILIDIGISVAYWLVFIGAVHVFDRSNRFNSSQREVPV